MKSATLMFALVAAAGISSGENTDFSKPTIGAVAFAVSDAVWPWRSLRESWPTERAVIVAHVAKESPADTAGLELGAVIYEVNRGRVTDHESFAEAIAQSPKGEDVIIRYYKHQHAGNRIIWRKRTAKVTPVTYAEFLASQTRVSENRAAEATIIEHLGDEETNNTNEVGLLLVEIDGGVTPLIRVRCSNPDWLFVRSYTFLIGDEKFEVTPQHDEIKRDNNASRCWEWCHIPADPNSHHEHWKIVTALAHGRESASVVLHGDTYRKEHEITADELRRIGQMRDYFHLKKEE